MTTTERTTHDALRDLLEFDHPVAVIDGVARDDLPLLRSVYAPECLWNEWGEGRHLEPGSEWVLLDGFSGQYRYSGPIMHASEYVGGGMADYILAHDGIYCVVVCSVLGDDPDASEDEEPAGWAVAWRELTDDERHEAMKADTSKTLPPECHHPDCDYRLSSYAKQTAEMFGVDVELHREIFDCNLGCAEMPGCLMCGERLDDQVDRDSDLEHLCTSCAEDES